MPVEIRGVQAVKVRTQKWRAFYENPIEYLTSIAAAAAAAARASLASGGAGQISAATRRSRGRRGLGNTAFVESGFILRNIGHSVRKGRRNVWEATITGPGTHPNTRPQAARTVGFAVTRGKRKGTIRRVTFARTSGLHWVALARAAEKRSGGAIAWPRAAVIRAAVKPHVDRIKEMAKRWTAEAKAFESRAEIVK